MYTHALHTLYSRIGDGGTHVHTHYTHYTLGYMMEVHMYMHTLQSIEQVIGTHVHWTVSSLTG